MGSGISGGSSVRSLAVFDDGTGPTLYVGGGFNSAGGFTANNIAKWNGCPAVANPADLNGDGLVNGADLAALLTGWGACPPPGVCPDDLTADGVVNAADLADLLSNWSP